MANTSRGLPLIDSTFAPDGPNQMNALANAVDALLPFLGSKSGTTDGSGYATVTHGAGFTPSRVFVQNTNTGGTGTTALSTGVDNLTATTFRLRFAGAPATAAYSLDFMAFR